MNNISSMGAELSPTPMKKQVRTINILFSRSAAQSAALLEKWVFALTDYTFANFSKTLDSVCASPTQNQRF